MVHTWLSSAPCTITFAETGCSHAQSRPPSSFLGCGDLAHGVDESDIKARWDERIDERPRLLDASVGWRVGDRVLQVGVVQLRQPGSRRGGLQGLSLDSKRRCLLSASTPDRTNTRKASDRTPSASARSAALRRAAAAYASSSKTATDTSAPAAYGPPPPPAPAEPGHHQPSPTYLATFVPAIRQGSELPEKGLPAPAHVGRGHIVSVDPRSLREHLALRPAPGPASPHSAGCAWSWRCGGGDAGRLDPIEHQPYRHRPLADRS